MAQIQTGSSSVGVANVDSNYNLQVRTPTTASQAGFTKEAAQVDAGTVTGTELVRALEVSEDYRLRVGMDTSVFDEVFAGAALNSALWTSIVTTMTTAVAAGFVTLNSGSSLAAAVAQVRSYRHFPVFQGYPTYFECVMQLTQAPVTNNVCEWGLMLASSTSAPTDGVFFRLAGNGNFTACVTGAGGEQESDLISNFATLVGTNTRHYIIAVNEDKVEFWIDDVLVKSLNRPVTGAAITNSNSLPIAFRTYQNTGVSAAQQMKVAGVTVSQGDSGIDIPFPHLMASMGRTALQGQTGQASLLQTAQLANNANPTAATPTNTTAALGTGLGGVFLANITGLAVTTDYILQSYQDPLGTAAIPGKVLMLTDIAVDIVNMGAANGAAPLTWELFLAFGHTNVSLAATAVDTATAKAARRMSIGVQTLAASAAIGIPASPTKSLSLQTPIPVQPGEFVQTVLRFINYTSTASQALWCYITLNGYWL